MKTFPLPALIAALAAFLAFPVSAEAAGLLLTTAAMGAIIWIDYSKRYRGLCVPRRVRTPAMTFRAPPLNTEPNRLAA